MRTHEIYLPIELIRAFVNGVWASSPQLFTYNPEPVVIALNALDIRGFDALVEVMVGSRAFCSNNAQRRAVKNEFERIRAGLEQIAIDRENGVSVKYGYRKQFARFRKYMYAPPIRHKRRYTRQCVAMIPEGYDEQV